MRPDGKARRVRIPGVFERGATQPGGMQRRPNAAGLSPRAAGMRERSPMGLAMAIGVLVFASDFLYSEAGRALQNGPAVRERPISEIVTAPVPLRDGIGEVSERVTRASPQANAFYNQG